MKGRQRSHSAAGLGHLNALRKATPGLGLEVVWIERAQVAGWGRSPVGGQGLPGSSTGGGHTPPPRGPSHRATFGLGVCCPEAPSPWVCCHLFKRWNLIGASSPSA